MLHNGSHDNCSMVNVAIARTTGCEQPQTRAGERCVFSNWLSSILLFLKSGVQMTICKINLHLNSHWANKSDCWKYLIPVTYAFNSDSDSRKGSAQKKKGQTRLCRTFVLECYCTHIRITARCSDTLPKSKVDSPWSLFKRKMKWRKLPYVAVVFRLCGGCISPLNPAPVLRQCTCIVITTNPFPEYL